MCCIAIARRAMREEWRLLLGLLPDAQPRPSHSDAATLDGLSRAVGEAHRRYTAFVNARARVTGHLFQGRFGCVAMDEAHMLNAVRYLAFNPVRARLCAKPREWEWSSVRAHLRGRDDALVDVGRFCDIAPRFGDLLEMSPGEQAELAGFEILGGNGRPPRRRGLPGLR